MQYPHNLLNAKENRQDVHHLVYCVCVGGMVWVCMHVLVCVSLTQLLCHCIQLCFCAADENNIETLFGKLVAICLADAITGSRNNYGTLQIMIHNKQHHSTTNTEGYDTLLRRLPAQLPNSFKFFRVNGVIT